MFYRLEKLSNATLSRELKSASSHEGTSTAVLVAHIAEFDRRKLYREAAYSSMHRYCVGELRLSEQAAYKRICAARLARQFPVIFAMLADRRLHLAGLVLLAPRLNRDNADELLKACVHRTKTGIEQLLAERFPQPDLPTRVEPLVPLSQVAQFRQLSPGIVAGTQPALGTTAVLNEPAPATPEPTPATRATQPTGRIEVPAPPARVMPLATQRYGVQLTVDQEEHELLEEAYRLLGPGAVIHGDAKAVFCRALRVLLPLLRKQKYAATDRPRAARPGSEDSRRIPAQVRREVWNRDRGQCTFVSPDGRRCEERSGLEFDHIDPYGQDGSSKTAANIRLRCRAHNQLEAERAYGAAFMEAKREKPSSAA